MNRNAMLLVLAPASLFAAAYAALRKKKYVGIDIRLYAMIRKSARKLRVPEEALINKWLRERV
ncbi:MAG: hypothetical protein HY897_10120 [Deltaproteobacteria bacterium]|nr:hypothetical protein [Deltaproteobacteria bacterium]